jgi:hypothetical protein
MKIRNQTMDCFTPLAMTSDFELRRDAAGALPGRSPARDDTLFFLPRKINPPGLFVFPFRSLIAPFCKPAMHCVS